MAHIFTELGKGHVSESYDKTWPSGEGNGKALQYSCLENPMNTEPPESSVITENSES